MWEPLHYQPARRIGGLSAEVQELQRELPKRNPDPAEDGLTLFAPAALAGLEFDHIGLIVPELAAGRVFLQEALGVSCWTAPVRDPGIQVWVQFGSAPGSELVYELVAPLGDTSPVANALRQGKSILNHVAYRTPRLSESADRLRALNCFPAGEPQPAAAYNGCLIQFWVTPLRFLIELIEQPGHRPAVQDAGEVEGSTAAKASDPSRVNPPSDSRKRG